MVGPRNSVVAALLGKNYDPLTDTSRWVMTGRMDWDEMRDEFPELWVDKIHDHVGDIDGSEAGGT